MPFPAERPRRLRSSERLRALVRETRLTPDQLDLPPVRRPRRGRAARDRLDARAASTCRSTRPRARRGRSKGSASPGVILFGLPGAQGRRAARATRTTASSSARCARSAAVPRAARHDRRLPVRVHDARPLRRARGRRTSATTRRCRCWRRWRSSHARAGADIVAPSDMMDGRVGAIRAALDAAGFDGIADPLLRGQVRVGVLRPVPRGGRLGARSSATAAATRWIRPTCARRCARSRSTSTEGADMVMVKPALPYLDVIRAVREPLRRAGRGLQRVGRVRDGEGGRAARLDRRGARGARRC